MKTYQEILDDVRYIQRKAEYIDSKAKEIIGDNYGKGHFDSMESEGALFSYEYNAACHCHPEYYTEKYHIKPEWIDAYISVDSDWDNGIAGQEDESKLIPLLQKAKEERDAQLNAQLKKIADKKKAEQDEICRIEEERERKEFERLSRKYEG